MTHEIKGIGYEHMTAQERWDVFKDMTDEEFYKLNNMYHKCDVECGYPPKAIHRADDFRMELWIDAKGGRKIRAYRDL